MRYDLSLSNNSYNLYNIPKDILHNIDGLLYPFNTSWKRIGVNVSGGADSALGTAILAELIEKNNTGTELHFITHVRNWKTRPWASYISIEVYEKIKEMFPSVKMFRHQGYVPPEIEHGKLRSINEEGVIEGLGVSGDVLCVSSFSDYIANFYELETVYNFITNNPTDIVHKWAPHGRTWDKSSVISAKQCPQIGEGLIQPWKLVTKDFIIAQYYKKGWHDLLDTTRSCETDVKKFPNHFFDYSAYKHGQTPLMTCCDITKDKDKWCYWCVEREWAKDQLK